MDWTELTPLSVANLTDLESRISAADAAVIAGKLSVYNAIVAKNIAPSSQAFADLVTAIGLLQTVASDSDLISSNIRSGKNIFGVSGNVIEGLPYATGTTSSVYRGDNGDILTVSGLTFTPKKVIVYRPTYSDGRIAQIYADTTVSTTEYQDLQYNEAIPYSVAYERKGLYYGGFQLLIRIAGALKWWAFA